jgi:ribosomal protein S12 methylthiotransferase accessory factor
MTEAAQSRLTHISGARDDMYRHTYQLQQQSKMSPHQWGQVLLNSRRSFDYAASPSLETQSLADDVALQVELLKKAGFKQAVVVDLTNPHFQISVAKVIIPGAEYKHPGFHKRFGARAHEQTLRRLIEKKFLKRYL